MAGAVTPIQPAGRLVPVFCANEHMRAAEITLSLAKRTARGGESVLLVDCQSGELMTLAGVAFDVTLTDVLFGEADINDAKYVTSDQNFTALAKGDVGLDAALGSLAALSLDFDWVFVGTPTGCTPSHVRLAGASDISLLAYDSHPHNFMRAYWMMDACRQRYPKFDPLLMSIGDPEPAEDTSRVLIKNINDFLGAPPPYMGHMENQAFIDEVLLSLHRAEPRSAVA